MKNQEIQHLKGHDILVLFVLILVTVLSYGHFSMPIFTSENISADRMRAEILAYQAAQIFLLKSVEKQPVQSRSLASESGSLDGLIGEDSKGRPFKYRVTPVGGRNFRVLLSRESDQPAGPPEAILDMKIEVAESTDS